MSLSIRPSRILVAVDLKGDSQALVQQAVELGKTLNASVRLAHVAPKMPVSELEWAPDTVRLVGLALQKRLEDEQNEREQKLETIARAQGTTYSLLRGS